MSELLRNTRKVLPGLALLSLLALCACQAQPKKAEIPDFAVEKVEEKSPHDPELIYIFPILKKGKTEIADKINAYLIREQLQLEYGKQKASIFENVWPIPDEMRPTVTSLDYKIENLSNKVYSITVSGEYCSAYCEGYDASYNFDLVTGELFSLDTLLTPAAKNELTQQLAKLRKDQIDSIMKVGRERLASDTLSGDDREYYTEMVEMYDMCSANGFYLESVRFIVMPSKIRFFLPRCSAHVNQNVDELWYIESEIRISDWKNKLSDYGRKILLD